MKKILLLFILCIIGVTLQLNAQSRPYEDVIYLNNGSIIKGSIVEIIPNKIVKIETREGNLLVYQIDEVEKITKELSTYNKRHGVNYGVNSSLKRGYMGLIEVGYGIGVGDYPLDRTTFNVINGYRIVPQFTIGFGVGIQYYSEHGYSELSLPIFAHLRSDLLSGNVSPYIACNVGYNVALDGGFFNGLIIEPALGVSFKVSQENRIALGVSYAINRISENISFGEYYGEYTEKAGAINIKVGFMF